MPGGLLDECLHDLQSSYDSNGSAEAADEAEFPFRLPNLLESHMRREASLQLEKTTPDAPHTRLVISNLVNRSRASCNAYNSNAKPVPEVVAEPTKARSSGAKADDDKGRRRKFHTLLLGPMRFTSKCRVRKASETVMPPDDLDKSYDRHQNHRKHCLGSQPREQTAPWRKPSHVIPKDLELKVVSSSSGDIKEKAKQPSFGKEGTSRRTSKPLTKRSITAFNEGEILKEPTSSSLVEKGLLPPISAVHTRPSDDRVNMSTSVKDRNSIQLDASLTSRKQTSVGSIKGGASRIYSPNEGSNSSSSNNNNNGNNNKRRAIRIRRGVPTVGIMTPARRIQMEDLNSLMLDLSSRDILIDRQVLERAMLHPEDVPRACSSKTRRISMGWGLLAIALHNANASPRDEVEDIDDLELQKDGGPKCSRRGKGIIPIHKLAVIPTNHLHREDSDLHLAGQSARTNTWWTKEEFLQMKRSWEERKRASKYESGGPVRAHFNSYVTSRPSTADTSTINTKRVLVMDRVPAGIYESDIVETHQYSKWFPSGHIQTSSEANADGRPGTRFRQHSSIFSEGFRFSEAAPVSPIK
ncbi:hypothetical protein HDU67_003306 [Dinochytrium kinnereticum]|nr:hypothetical protein HDU67_003306 [Dinochytrium kinnereticum]